MKVIQDYGFKHKTISNNFGSYHVEIRGTGLENNTYSYINVNGENIDKSTSRGFTLVRFTREMSLIDISRYDVYGNNMDTVAFTEKMYEVGENMYFAIYSYDAHQNVEIVSEMGGVYYENIKRNLGGEFRTYRTPYACFGTGRKNKNNVPTILYESIGDWRPNSDDPYALLSFTIGLPEYACLNQVSDNLLGYMSASNVEPLSNTTFISNTKLLELKLRGRILSNITQSNDFVNVVVTVNGSVAKTVSLTNSYFENISEFVDCEIDDEIGISFSTSGDYEISFIGVFEKTYLDLDNKSQTISKSVLGGRRNLISTTGHEYSSVGDIDKISGIEPFKNTTHNIGNTILECYQLNGTVESDFIEIDNDKSYTLFAYVIGSNSNINISLTAIDDVGAISGILENNNLVSTGSVINKTVEPIPSIISVPIYKRSSSSTEKHHSGYYKDQGYETHTYDEKPIYRLRSNTDSIKIEMSGSGIVKLKLVEHIYAFKSGGIILGNFIPD